MMRLIASFLFLISSLSLSQTTSDVQADRSIYTYDLAKSWQASAELEGAPEYEIDLELSDDLRTITGSQTTLVTNTSRRILNDVLFRLYPNALGSEMSVSRVEVEGREIQGELEQENTSLRILLPRPLFPGEAVEVGLEFSLKVSNSNVSYGRLSMFEDAATSALNLAHGYPTLSVLDDEGWRNELPDPEGDPLVAEAGFYEVSVTAPLDTQLATSGILSKQLIQEGKQLSTFSAGPARDFYLSALRGYVKQSLVAENVLINSYTPAALSEAAQSSLEDAAQALNEFATFGAYPYRELDIVALPVSAGGIEYPGIVVLANNIYRDEGTLESVLAHEIGHQWAFNLVGSDQILEPWLDESLTQYLTSVYHDKYGGERFNSGYLEYWENVWDNAEDEDKAIGLDVAAYTPREYSAIVYGRGLFFFRELEEELGRDVLQAGLRTYFDTYAWQFATPNDLKTILETECACDLDTTFARWGAS